jgi:hypothetical protein
MKQGRRMMLALALALLSATRVALSQEEENYFQLKVNGRSREVQRILDHQPGRGARNVLFLVSPMTCPRCEGMMFDLMRQLDERMPGGARVCVISYPRLSGAIAYAGERKFPAHTIIDTAGALFAELGLEQAPPFISVWDSTGLLLFSQAIYGLSNDDPVLWKNILHAEAKSSADAVPMPLRPRSLDVGYDETMVSWSAPVVERRVRLQEDSSCTLGVVGFPAVNRIGTAISLTDYLTLTARLFDLRSGRCLRSLAPDYELRKRFSPDIGKSEFLEYENSGIAHSMLFGGYFSSDTTMRLVGSLPEFKEVISRNVSEGVGAQIAYYNAAVVIDYSISSGSADRVTRIQPPKSELTVTHSVAAPVPSPTGKEIAVIVGKGYPYVGTTTATAVGPNNPLDPAFYGHAPLFTTFDPATGAPRRELGRLDTLCRRLGIGYALANPRIAFAGNDYFIAQNPVPYIVTGKGKTIPLRSYFNRNYLDTIGQAGHLPSIEAIREMVEMVGGRVVDIAAQGNDLFVTWHVKRRGRPMKDDYLICVQRYSITKGSLTREWGIPFRSGDGTLAALTVDPRTRRAYCVYQTGASTTVTVDRLD